MVAIIQISHTDTNFIKTNWGLDPNAYQDNQTILVLKMLDLVQSFKMNLSEFSKLPKYLKKKYMEVKMLTIVMLVFEFKSIQFFFSVCIDI